MLTTVVSCPNRGRGGDAAYPGNWGGEFVRQVLDWFHPALVIDVMAGSGTTGDVAEVMGIPSDCYDLRPDPPVGAGGWNVLEDEPARGAPMVLGHWPYWDMYRYSEIWGKGDARDLSCVPTYEEFLYLSGRALARMLQWVDVGGHVGVLVGSIRRRGRLYDMALDLPKPAPVAYRLIKVQHNTRSDGRQYRGKVLPIVHEDFLVFRRESPYIFSGSVPRHVKWDLRLSPNTTWRGAVYAALMALGGEADMSEIYAEIQSFAITKDRNHFWKEKVRQILQKCADFSQVRRGRWRVQPAIENSSQTPA